MSNKTTVSASLSENTVDSVEQYANERGISKSAAIDELLNRSLKLEDSDSMVIVPDGGEVRERMKQQDNKISQLEQELETEVQQIEDEFKNEFKDDIEKNKLTYILLAAGLVYSLFELAIGLPSLVTVGVGVSLIVSILYVYLVR
jgi:membrane-bound ClpP family serine protease